MRTWIIYVWDALRNKLWFLPSLFSLAGVLLAIATVTLDHRLELGTEELLPSLETTGAAGRTVLGALIGGLVTVVGLAFSLTMLSISQTSSQYGPRLVRTLFDSNITQYTLGFILGTIVYSMVVLRSIRDLESGEPLFTPHLSILIAELAGAGSVIGLLVLTNHMMQCMRAETLTASVYHTVLHTIENLFPEMEVRNASEDVSLATTDQWLELPYDVELRSRSAGHLQAIDLNRIVQMAKQQGHRIDITARPGDFIYEGVVLGRVHREECSTPDSHRQCEPRRDEDEQKDWVGDYVAAFLMGSVRTPRQDVEAGMLELVEAGVRALSPGINDPITAINVIDYLSSLLGQLVRREPPGRVLLDAQGTPRVRVETPSFGSVLETGFNQLRQYAAASVAVYCRLLEGLSAIAMSARRGEDRRAIGRQAEMILRQAERIIEEPNDLADIRERYENVEKTLQDFQKREPRREL